MQTLLAPQQYINCVMDEISELYVMNLICCVFTDKVTGKCKCCEIDIPQFDQVT